MADADRKAGPPPDFTFKVLLLGPLAVGKTSLIIRAAQNSFSPSYIGTIGVEFKPKQFTLPDGTRTRLQLFDTAGQERFMALTRGFFRGAHAFVLVLDVSSKDSIEGVKAWHAEMVEHSGVDKPPFAVLVGNKCDILSREVSTKEGGALAKSLRLPYFETSARRGTGVAELFEHVAQTLTDRRRKEGGPGVPKRGPSEGGAAAMPGSPPPSGGKGGAGKGRTGESPGSIRVGETASHPAAGGGGGGCAC